MKPWMATALLIVPVVLCISLAGRSWELGQLTTVALVGVGAVVACIPIVLDEIRLSERAPPRSH